MVPFDKLWAGSHPSVDGPLKRFVFLTIARFSHGKASRDLEKGDVSVSWHLREASASYDFFLIDAGNKARCGSDSAVPTLD